MDPAFGFADLPVILVLELDALRPRLGDLRFELFHFGHRFEKNGLALADLFLRAGDFVLAGAHFFFVARFLRALAFGLERFLEIFDLALGERALRDGVLARCEKAVDLRRARGNCCLARCEVRFVTADHALLFLQARVEDLKLKEHLELGRQFPVYSCLERWAHQDSNLGPEDYESPALTN